MAAFARYDGIDGESQDADHNQWIEVLSIDWGAHNPGGSADATRRRSAAVVEDLSLTMDYEKAVPKLQERCLKGEVIPKLELELTGMYRGARATYLAYELKNVVVTSFQTSASGNDEAGPPTVAIGNSFEEIKVTYTEYDETGMSRGNVETSFKVDTGV